MKRITLLVFTSLALGIFLSFGCSGGGGGGSNGLDNQASETKLQDEASSLRKEGQSCFETASCEDGLLCIAGICQQYIEPVILPPESVPDETAPTMTVQCPEEAISNKENGEISLSADVEADIFCGIDDSVMDKCSSPFKYSGLSDGAHIFRAYAVGANQKASETVVCQWVTDVTKPEVVKISIADKSFVPSTTKNFVFEFSEPVVSSGNVKLKMNWSDIAGGGALSEDGMQYTFIARGAGLADGDYVMTVSGFKDDAGNVMDEDSVSFTVDDVMPAVQIICPSKTLTNVNSGSIAFASKENVQFLCRLDGGAEKACVSPFAYEKLSDGKHTFELFTVAETQKKTGGGTCSWVTDATPPKVTATDPANASVVNMGTSAFKLNFSEPVAQAGEVKIGSSAYAVPGSGTLSSDKTSYTFTTNGGELKPGNFTITAKGFKDAAGNVMPDHNSTFTAKFVPNPVIPNGAWKANLAAGVHPRLFGNKARFLELKAKKPKLFAQMQASVAANSDNIIADYFGLKYLNLSILSVDSLVYATTGKSVYKDAIKKMVNIYLNDPKYNSINPATKWNPFNDHYTTYQILYGLVTAYDLYHDLFTADERKQMIEHMNKHLGVYTIDEDPFSANTKLKIMAYLTTAYATWNENPRAVEFRDHAIKTMYEKLLLPALQYVGEGGAGSGEGGWYERGFMPYLMEGLEMARLFEGYDGFEKAPNFFYSKLAYEMSDSYPGYYLKDNSLYKAANSKWERFPEEGDGSLYYGGYSSDPAMTRTMLAEYYRGTELARQIANKNAYLTEDQLLVQEPRLQRTFYLYANSPPEDPIGISQMPLAHLASGEGRLYARSSWADDASFLRFECGPFFTNHQHFEVGNFEIFRNGHLATESGGYFDKFASYHAVNWAIRTIAHNSMLVFDPNEFEHDYTYFKTLEDGGRLKTKIGAGVYYGNDGGQSLKWNVWIDTMDEWLVLKGYHDEYVTFYNYAGGTIVGYENTPQYMFAACDGTAAYEPDKMGKWVREIVFLRPHTFVILDRVVSTKAELPKTWLIHSVNQPVVEDASRSFTITKDGGKLYGKTLLPDKATMKPIDGYRYGGNDYPIVSKIGPEYVVGYWRIEVKPTEAKKEDVFLHVLSTDGPPNAKLITGTPAGTVSVDVNGTKVYFTNDVGGQIKIGTTTYQLEAKVKKNKYE